MGLSSRSNMPTSKLGIAIPSGLNRCSVQLVNSPSAIDAEFPDAPITRSFIIAVGTSPDVSVQRLMRILAAASRAFQLPIVSKTLLASDRLAASIATGYHAT